MKSSPLWFGLLGSLVLVGCGEEVTSASGDGSSGGDETSGSTGGTEVPAADTGETGGESSGDTGSVDESTGEPPEPEPAPLMWIDECVAAGTDLHDFHPELDCTSIEVPLDWDDPEGEAVLIAAVRVPTSVQTRRGELWMLDGGPGGSGIAYLLDTELIEAVRAEGWDVIVPSHRGTLSPRLACAGGNGYTQACRLELDEEWGEGLRHFNTVAAARDVGELISRSPTTDGELTIVYGVSYGTYWAQYYAGENPGQADGIILDSVVPTDADLAAEELIVQDVAEDLLQVCVDDPICGPRVGFSSGAEFSAAVLAALDDGECGIGDSGMWSDSDFRFRFGQLVNSNGARNLFPLLAAMLARCDPALTDIVRGALGATAQAVPGRPGEPVPLPFGGPQNVFFSSELQATVFGTQLIAPDADPEAAATAADDHIASLGFGNLEVSANELYGELPNAPFDQDFVAIEPMLVLNGRFDLQTVYPWAEIAAAQHGVDVLQFADSRHGAAFTGSGGDFPDGTPCARDIVLQFAAAPTTPPDTTCIAELPGIDVNLQREDLQPIIQDAFGTDDPWSLLPSE